ncbi:hypothetical protein [Liquorilactobacillus mali]|uniref:Uncharacterized protein n=1 Tax=Liquorilactobacillus mali KCTC 3596 = DSM 20444 TaxID=1046596 RepID=A0A0R2ED39_9LACO|nr:hypothetical protein [Liquorilactobacillus mali]KRN10791.1 hypothetical protein FD00_GL002033 [Liquorilactobacillus mali KCTC 3596 = DSM 20444]
MKIISPVVARNVADKVNKAPKIEEEDMKKINEIITSCSEEGQYWFRIVSKRMETPMDVIQDELSRLGYRVGDVEPHEEFIVTTFWFK